MAPDLRIIAKKLVILPVEKAQKIYEKVRESIKKAVQAPEQPSLVNDDLTRKIWPELKDVALELICAKKLGRSILLRFHGDADGICGAFAITNIVSCKAYQQNSAIYGIRDALRDIGTVGQENRPLVMLLDFGSSDACLEALELLRAAGIQHIIVDHHPPGLKMEKIAAVNPFKFAPNASKYTAGYLACEAAIACGMDKDEALALAKTACAGDKSSILEVGPVEKERALVLDFLAAHISFGNNLEFYKKVMSNAELFRSIAQQARESIEEAAQKATRGMKKTTVGGKLEIATFPLEKIAKVGEWPPSSKITTHIYEKISNEQPEKPVLCIGYTDRSLIIRLNDSAAELGLSANELAERLKKTMPDFVEGGGGHVRAGAIRVRTGFAKEVLAELVRTISTISD